MLSQFKELTNFDFLGFATFYEDNITTTTTDTATYGRNISEKTIVSPISNSFPTPDRERECKFIKVYHVIVEM